MLPVSPQFSNSAEPSQGQMFVVQNLQKRQLEKRNSGAIKVIQEDKLHQISFRENFKSIVRLPNVCR